MPSASIKAAARRLIDQLPEGATWDELDNEIEVRASIERGLADAGRLIPQEDMEKTMDRLWATEAEDRLAAYRRREIKAVELDEVLAKYRTA